MSRAREPESKPNQDRGPGLAGLLVQLVVGLPLNMDDTEGPRSKPVRAFAARIGERVGRVVHFQDERLTSAAADWSMARLRPNSVSSGFISTPAEPIAPAVASMVRKVMPATTQP